MATRQEVESRLRQTSQDREGVIELVSQLDEDIPDLTGELIVNYITTVEWFQKNAKKVVDSKEGKQLKKPVEEELKFAKNLNSLYKDKLQKKKITFPNFKQELVKLNKTLINNLPVSQNLQPVQQSNAQIKGPSGGFKPPQSKPITESQEMAEIMRQFAEQEAKDQMGRSASKSALSSQSGKQQAKPISES